MSKQDFTHGIVCMLQGHAGQLEDENRSRLFDCAEVGQMNAAFTYDRHDEVLSKFINVRYTGIEDIFVSMVQIQQSFHHL